MMEVARVKRLRLFCENVDDFDTCVAQGSQAATSHLRVWIDRPNHHLGHSGIDEGVGTRRSSTLVGARLECGDNRCAAGVACVFQSKDLGMRQPGSLVRTLSHDDAFGIHDQRAYPRIGMGARAGSQVNGFPHQILHSLSLREGRRARAHRPPFSHPDFHRRPRNLTGSTSKEVRGLSPPVGNCTLPRRGATAEFSSGARVGGRGSFPTMPIPPFETDRLVLRPFALGDLEAFHLVWGDPEVIWWGHTETLEESKERLAAFVELCDGLSEGLGWSWLIDKATGAVYGDVALQPAPDPPGGVEIGWHLARRAWGNGYATEGAAPLLPHGWTLGLAEVIATIVPTNRPSVRVAERLGMERRAGDFERTGLIHGVWVARPPLH